MALVSACPPMLDDHDTEKYRLLAHNSQAFTNYKPLSHIKSDLKPQIYALLSLIPEGYSWSKDCFVIGGRLHRYGPGQYPCLVSTISLSEPA